MVFFVKASSESLIQVGQSRITCCRFNPHYCSISSYCRVLRSWTTACWWASITWTWRFESASGTTARPERAPSRPTRSGHSSRSPSTAPPWSPYRGRLGAREPWTARTSKSKLTQCSATISTSLICSLYTQKSNQTLFIRGISYQEVTQCASQKENGWELQTLVKRHRFSRDEKTGNDVLITLAP